MTGSRAVQEADAQINRLVEADRQGAVFVTKEQYLSLVSVLASTIEYRRAKHAMDKATEENDLEANRRAYEWAERAGPEIDQALVELGINLEEGT